MRREAGIWVFYNPITGKIGTADVPTNQTSYAGTDFSNPPIWGRRVMIADIHVHPHFRSHGYHLGVEHEVEKQFHKGVPGIAITELGPIVYGPERLGSSPELVLDIPGYASSKNDARTFGCP
jgi:hypothetical protein